MERVGPSTAQFHIGGAGASEARLTEENRKRPDPKAENPPDRRGLVRPAKSSRFQPEVLYSSRTDSRPIRSTDLNVTPGRGRRGFQGRSDSPPRTSHRGGGPATIFARKNSRAWAPELEPSAKKREPGSKEGENGDLRGAGTRAGFAADQGRSKVRRGIGVQRGTLKRTLGPGQRPGHEI